MLAALIVYLPEVETVVEAIQTRRETKEVKYPHRLTNGHAQSICKSLKLLKGKSCFRIRELDEELEAQIEDALDKGFELYKQRGWI